MKRFTILAALIALVGCAQYSEELDKIAAPTQNQTEFYASMPECDTRTYVEDNKYLRWNAGDEITIFNGNSYNSHWKFAGEDGANSGKFTEVEENGFVTGTPLNLTANYAIYPYNENITITEAGVVALTLPAVQEYNHIYANSFGAGTNTMMAVTKNTLDNFLAFKNLCGYLKLKFYGDDITIKSITVKGNNGEKIAGSATVSMAYGSEPTITMGDDATDTITIDCGEGVSLSNDSENPTIFWAVIPETTFEGGITIEVTDTNDQTFSKTTTNAVPIENNMIQPMAALEVECEKTMPNPANNEIWYKTINGDVVEPFTSSPVQCDLVSASYITNVYNAEIGYGIMTFEKEITQVNMQAFYNAVSVQTIILPESVERIGQAAFQGCSNLENIHIGKSVKQIDYNAFYNCSNLKKVDISDLSAWCNISFYHYASQPLHYAHKLYVNNRLLRNLYVPNDVNEIREMSFYCCESIETILFSANVGIIGACAFYGCSSITKLSIPLCVNTIGTYAFRRCVNLVEVDICQSIQSIGLGSFDECSSLSHVYCRSTTPPEGGLWMFDSNALNRKIFVPASDDDSIINAYKSANVWSNYAAYIEEFDFTE